MSADEQHRPAGRVDRWIDRGTDFVGVIISKIPTSVTQFTLKLWALLVGRRITGLAAEAAFWVVFSLPWLMLAFVSGLGVSAKYLGEEAVDQVKESIENVINTVLTPEAASQFALPVVNEVFNETRPDLGIIGLVIALWAGSRAVMVYVQSIMLINGEYVERSYIRRRGLSLVLYAVGAVLSVSLLPILLIGPKKLGEWLNLSSVGITIGYVVVVVFASITMLWVLLHYSSVKKQSMVSALPGTLVALVTGATACLFVTLYVRNLFAESSVYGVLATPIALMVYAFVISFTVLLGAAVNAVLGDREIFAPDNNPHLHFRRSTKLVEQLAPTETSSADASKA
ncbi:MAG: YhjD/YihY/BrkB family envelope integrity protein [Candidatus Nanopelagicales bacterium]